MQLARLSLISALLLFVAAPVAYAASCTDGVDCYCDTVSDSEHANYDANLLMCEDWEAATLYENVDEGVTTGTFGPWYDDTDFAGARGANSYWNKVYSGNNENRCAWRSGNPSSPTVGDVCSFATCFPGEFRADDLWQANSFACIDIVRDGEFDDDFATNTELTGGSGNRTGVFDGRQSLGLRVPVGKPAGAVGDTSFTSSTTVGITMAVGYAANVETAGILAFPWKHDGVGTSSGTQYPTLGWATDAPGGRNTFPYGLLIRTAGSTSTCETAAAAATIHVGRTPTCESGFMLWGPNDADYSQPTDFPLATWGCHRGYIAGLGTSSVTIKVWHDEVLIYHMTGLDGTILVDQAYNRYKFNNYANANNGLGEIPSTENSARYEDNIHITNGVPVSCSQLGFTFGGPTPTPTTTPTTTPTPTPTATPTATPQPPIGVLR